MDLNYYESICGDIVNNKLDSHETNLLNPSQRKEIYKIIESYGLHGISLEMNNSSNSRMKKIKIVKNTNENLNLIQLTDDMLQLFSNYSNLPNLQNKNIDSYKKLYGYFDKLEKYYPNIKSQWDTFFNEVKICGTSQMRENAKNTKKLIFDYIFNNEEYQQYLKQHICVNHSNLFTGDTIYKPENDNKTYVCVDIKSAVYQVLKNECPSIIQNWNDLVTTFTNSIFFKQSKQFRKDIFIGLECSELLSDMSKFIKPIDELVKSNIKYFSNMKKVLCMYQNDEIIFETSESFNIEEFIEDVNKINSEIYTITKFKLEHLKEINNKYYKKIFLNEFEQFKCIPKDDLFDVILNIQECKLTNEMINFFSKYSIIPIPIFSPKYVNYYLEELKKYYDCEQWDTFLQEIKERGFNNLKNEVKNTKIGIINLIKSNEEYINFTNTKIESNGKTITKKSIYNNTNANKYFLSIDVKSANFTNLKKHCPSIEPNWKSLVGLFTNSKFLADSKYLREVIFGELSNKKLINTIQLIILEVDNILKSKNFYNQLTKIMESSDEIIYQIENDFDINNIKSALSVIDPMEQIYRIEKFKLIQLSPYQYFVKELSDGKIQFKSIPKCFIMQCIKHYTNSELNELDKKFTYEDFEATFSDLLVFE